MNCECEHCRIREEERTKLRNEQKEKMKEARNKQKDSARHALEALLKEEPMEKALVFYPSLLRKTSNLKYPIVGDKKECGLCHDDLDLAEFPIRETRKLLDRIEITYGTYCRKCLSEKTWKRKSQYQAFSIRI